MEIIKLFQGETNANDPNRFQIKRETVLNMVGVVLFYVILFVAVSVFSS